MPHSSKGIENLVWASTDVLSAVKGTIRVNSWDAPWIVMDPRDVQKDFGWQIQTPLPKILEEIADHHRQHPEFLELSDSK